MADDKSVRISVFESVRDGLSPSAAAKKHGIANQIVYQWLAEAAIAAAVTEPGDPTRPLRPDDAADALRIVRECRTTVNELRADVDKQRQCGNFRAVDQITRSMAALSQTMVRLVESHPGLMQLAGASGADTTSKRLEAVNAFLERLN